MKDGLHAELFVFTQHNLLLWRLRIFRRNLHFFVTRRRRKLVAMRDVPAVVPRTLQLLAVNSAQGRALRLRATLEKRFSFPASRPGPGLDLG